MARAAAGQPGDPQKWPFSAALLARAVVIATTVLVAVLTRLAQRFLDV